MSRPLLLAVSIGCVGLCSATESIPDAAFLEWLGQTAEIEELGVDIGQMMDQQEEQTPEDSNLEKSQ